MLIPVILIVGIIVFALIHLTPGDPAAVILGDQATPEAVANLREQLGLNDPLPVQFIHWFSGVLHFDFGESIFMGEPVTRALLDRAQPTILLTIYALMFQIAIGVPAGVISAVKHNSIVDRIVTGLLISTLIHADRRERGVLSSRADGSTAAAGVRVDSAITPLPAAREDRCTRKADPRPG
jgi:ABC-type dipeptide/oligopeptide/nickel transport system permease component